MPLSIHYSILVPHYNKLIILQRLPTANKYLLIRVKVEVFYIRDLREIDKCIGH